MTMAAPRTELTPHALAAGPDYRADIGVLALSLSAHGETGGATCEAEPVHISEILPLVIEDIARRMERYVDGS